MKRSTFENCDFLFGGSFDPPHFGHLEVVQELFENHRPNQVTLLPAGLSPLKNKLTSTPAFHRAEMLKRAFTGLGQNRSLTVDLREVQKMESEGAINTPTYSTLKELGAPDRKWVFVMGLDQFENWPKWVNFPEVLKLCHWLVLIRKPMLLSDGLKIAQIYQTQGLLKTAQAASRSSAEYGIVGTQFTLQLSLTNAREASSTAIRSGIATAEQSVLKLVPEPVLEYLKLHSLYGTGNPL